MIKQFKTIHPMATALERLLHPYAEIVIHDLKKNEIAAIFHPFSKRRVGDPSLLTPEEMDGLEDSIGPYEKINWDGRKLKSVSSIIRDERRKAIGMLCINLDLSLFEKFSHLIADFMGKDQLKTQPAALFKDDWQEKVNHYIHAYLKKKHLNLESLTRNEKKELLEHLSKIGAFTAKNSALYIAQVLGVSRATIYNYLAKNENRSKDAISSL